MQKKITGWKTKGMNRDLSVSAYNPEFAFENINLRLSTNEGNTMLSWVNERGPKELSVSIDEKPWITDNRVYQIGDVVNEVALVEGDELVGKDKYTTTSIEGIPIGTAVIDHKLVLFTTEVTSLSEDDKRKNIRRPPEPIFIGDDREPIIIPDTGSEDDPGTTEGGNDEGSTNEGGDDTIVDGGGGNDEPVVIKKPDRIYVFEKSSSNQLDFIGKLIYHGNLGFCTEFPIETLVSFESNLVEKVYWTDGLNQPRLINIENKDKYGLWNGTDGSKIDTFFDFIPSITTLGSTTVTVTKQSGDGTFAPGVIQYAFTYVNKYGQQSNAFYVSPLYYISHNDRGASPEDKVSCQFDISITNPDTKFDYVRVYSIQRTSINMEPFVKFLEDLKITGNTLKYTDNGTTGSTVDPTEMLYVGGKEITALTMTEKDHTLFMGNIVQRNTSVDAIQDIFDDLRESGNSENKISIEFQTDQIRGRDKVLHLNPASGVYSYTNELDNNRREITTFKGGDTYRFGFQLQKATGEWLEPIFIDDATNDKYPFTAITTSNDVYLPYAMADIKFKKTGSPLANIDLSEFVCIRPVVVYPNIVDRNVLCQGVLNPTVFNALDRIDNSPFAQASWYFRPYSHRDTRVNISLQTGQLEGSSAIFEHYASILDDTYTQVNEIQGSVKLYNSVYSTQKNTRNNNEIKANTQFFVDHSIVTLNSPDIDFDTEVQTYSMENLKLRIVGAIPITANASAHSIKASTMPPAAFNNKRLVKSDGEFIDDPSPDLVIKTGTGEISANVKWTNINKLAGHRLIAEELWNDVRIISVPNGAKVWLLDESIPYFGTYLTNFCIYPWHSKGSLCNDPRSEDEAFSILKQKIESNILFSTNSVYLNSSYNFNFGNVENPNIPDIDIQIHLTENSNIVNNRLNRARLISSSGNQQPTLDILSINYYPNIDKLLYNDEGSEYYLLHKDADSYGLNNYDTKYTSSIVPMKYKSTSHAIIAFDSIETTDIDTDNPASHLCTPILPYGTITYTENESSQTVNIGNYSYPSSIEGRNTFWGDKVYVAQRSIDLDGIRASNQNLGQYQYLWLGELYKPEDQNKVYFGGTTKEAIKANNWVVGGEAQTIPSSGEVELVWTEGDTYYQRYDCLKTYAYTPEDINQIVEILSFMCETHVNLDGRYDKNRGQIDNTNMSPQNFNLLNPVYTQQDNFFSYKKSDTDTNEDLKYPNYIYYSKTKQSGADVDLYTNVTLGSVLELDGNKGSINSLQRINDQIIAFQDTGISQILYNENAAISTTQGVPIELGNSGKVQGARYLSDTIGCSNKWSIASALTGLYFIDSNSKGIFRFDGKLNNLSTSLGFNSWSKQNIHYTGGYWTPDSFDDFVTYYDKVNQDILFINKKTALSYSEKFQMFQSFYDYNEAPYLVNLDDKSLWINTDTSGTYKLWEHNAGEYCNFFGTVKPFSMTLIGNPEPQMDKIFTNLEFRASVGDDGEYVDNTGKFTPTLPFDSLETWNEYQHGITNLKNLTGIDAVRHHIGGDSSLKRKFRMWRCDIPRDNADLSKDAGMNISRYKIHHMDRMRNPWLYLKLTKNAYYTDEEVTEHNSKIDGAVTVNTLVPESDTVEYYTKEQANTLNTSIEGAWQYNTQPKPIKKTEIHDLLMTYFS